ncbi:MAG: DNA primase small subunit domain-containing protein [Nitrososphaerales archaeon]|jgi:DNA primase small subunit
MDEKVVSFLRRVYREHYFKHHDLVEIPESMASREFGYIPFGGGMVRHLSFKNPGELFAELVRQAPSSVYCSNAVYERPTLQMDEKGWKGAYLIFDIDADAIPTPCKARHTWWFCGTCHRGGMGVRPARCPGCKDQSVEQMHWSCRECLNATKGHVKRLVDFLRDDFGVQSQDIQVYFSGNRGYHAHVHDERFATADPQMRTEIANYVKGTGINLKSQSMAPGHAEVGWGRRAALFMASTEAGTSRSKNNQKLTNQVVTAYGAMVDESVTTDVHRVFRMPGTLHGNSGLLKMRVESLEGFDPQRQPVVLGGDPVSVRVYYAPEFFLNGNRYGPYDSSAVEIPIYAAVFLLARGLGEVN